MPIPARVHGREPQLREFRKTLVDRAQEPRLEQVGAELAGVGKAVGPEMLFERDLLSLPNNRTRCVGSRGSFRL
jgi:hypothetical protein